MSEQLKPGRELDKLVAKIVGYPGRIPPQYSTSPNKAIELFEWLEHNNPWQPIDTDPGDIYLSRYWINGAPAVIVIMVAGAEIVDYRPEKPLARYNFAIWGESYPHAICLAILATRKADA